MIKHLLVPLDGSPLAESVLPVTAILAKKTETDVTLIHIVEEDPPEKIHGQQHLTSPEQAKAYLKSISELKIFKGVKVEIHVHEERVQNIPLSIAEHTNELHQDLIVMCTHGSGGLHEFLFGSIAQKVISIGKKPLLLINPDNTHDNCKFNNFLIPLDGNPEHEGAVHFASWLAKICGAAIHLLMAIPYFGNMSGKVTASNRFLPGTTSKMMDMIIPDALEYLEKIQKDLTAEGLKVTSSATRDNPDKAIIDMAKDINADLIIQATHGTMGVEAFWEGSITPRVSKISKIPILLVPVI
ncbi:MAG: universal stress protein [Ignavibacteriaceae bacterium]